MLIKNSGSLIIIFHNLSVAGRLHRKSVNKVNSGSNALYQRYNAFEKVLAFGHYHYWFSVLALHSKTFGHPCHSWTNLFIYSS